MSKSVIKRDTLEEPGTLITYTKMAASPYVPEEADELYQPMPMYTQDTLVNEDHQNNSQADK